MKWDDILRLCEELFGIRPLIRPWGAHNATLIFYSPTHIPLFGINMWSSSDKWFVNNSTLLDNDVCRLLDLRINAGETLDD